MLCCNCEKLESFWVLMARMSRIRLLTRWIVGALTWAEHLDRAKTGHGHFKTGHGALGRATTRAWSFQLHTLHWCERARPQKKTVTHFFISHMSEQLDTEMDSSVTNLI